MSWVTKTVELKLRKVFKWATDKIMGGVAGDIEDDELIEKLNKFSFSKEQKKEIIAKLVEVVFSTKKLFDQYRTLSSEELSSNGLEGAKKWIKDNYELMNNTGKDLATIYQKFKEDSYTKLIKSTKLPLNTRFNRLLDGKISKNDMDRLIFDLKSGRVNKDTKKLIEKLEKGRTVSRADLKHLKEYALNKAELRARNEAGNLYANELEGFLLEEGNGLYKWRTMKDTRVRGAHAEKDGKIFSVNDGILPGQDFGCRCWAEPIKRKER